MIYGNFEFRFPSVGFGTSVPLKLLFFLQLRELECKTLRQVLNNNLGSIIMGDVCEKRDIALAIPTIDINRHAAVVFKTKHLKRLNGRDDSRTLVDVCMATSAAPILYSMAELTELNTIISTFYN